MDLPREHSFFNRPQFSVPVPAPVIQVSGPMDYLRFSFDQLSTPIGDLLIVADHEGNLRATFWTEQKEDMERFLGRHYSGTCIHLEPTHYPHGLADAIASYFAGDLHAIDQLPVKTAGTPFQRQVWHALRGIPCGTTTSYAQLAARIGRPTAVRAVGLANGSNPVGIVVPCHRVIGSNGSLTGYGGGIERKRWLLDHERQMRL